MTEEIIVKSITAYSLYEFVLETSELAKQGFSFVDTNMCTPRVMGSIYSAVMAKGIEVKKHPKTSAVIKDSDPSIFGLVPKAPETTLESTSEEATPSQDNDSSVAKSDTEATAEGVEVKRRGRKPAVQADPVS
jgi:hypothetical protein